MNDLHLKIAFSVFSLGTVGGSIVAAVSGWQMLCLGLCLVNIAGWIALLSYLTFFKYKTRQSWQKELQTWKRLDARDPNKQENN